MNYTARLIALKRMKSEIETTTEILSMTPGGKIDTSILGRIERWTQQIAITEKQIKSGHHLNALRYGQLRFAKDRNARYRARQAHQSREANLAEIDAVLAKINIALGALYRQKGADTPPEAQAIEAIGNAMQNILKAMNAGDATAMQGLGQEQQVVSAAVRQLENRPDAPGGPAGAFPVIDMFTLILAYFALLKSMRK